MRMIFKMRPILIGALAALCVHGIAVANPGSVLSSQKISDTAGNFLEPLGNFDEFGGAVVGLGDLDGAGPSVVALAVGAIGDDDGGTNRGCVYILFLNSGGAVLSYQKISDTAGNFLEPLGDDDEFGGAVAFLGDLDGAGNFTATIDNLDEFGGSVTGLGDLDGAGPSVAALAVGAAADDDGGSDRGCIYVLFLASTGNVLSFQKISDTAGNFTEPLSNADGLGSAVGTLGDLDGAGAAVSTLVVGAPGDDDGGSDRGCIYIMFLNAAGSVVSYQKISDTAGNFTEPLGNLDEFGGAVAGLGDVDRYGPAVAAVGVGAIGDDDGGSGRGAAYVLFLDSAGLVLSYQKISATTGGFAGPLDDGDEFGGTLCALGDLDGTGQATQTLVVGAVGDDDGGSTRGAVWVLGLDGITTSDAAPVITTRHRLGAARPNPFNPRTLIPYTLAHDARVRIEILDVRGKRVRSLLDVGARAGTHDALWDGLDDAGRPLASGAYVVRMSVDGQPLAATEKALLVK